MAHEDNGVTFVGHSKGGTEAVANAIATNKDAIVFNPMILNCKDYNLDLYRYSGKVTSIVVKGEFLNVRFGDILKGSDKCERKYLTSQYSALGGLDSLGLNHEIDSVIAAIREENKK